MIGFIIHRFVQSAGILMLTSVLVFCGVFAIGDVASYPGKLKLILQGFSEAAMAAHAIYPIVFPEVALHFEYSTTKGVPG